MNRKAFGASFLYWVDFMLQRWLLVMSSSWNFPSRARKILSRAELGYFNFWAEMELSLCTSIWSKFLAHILFPWKRSRVELRIVQLEPWLKQAWLGLITSNSPLLHLFSSERKIKWACGIKWHQSLHVGIFQPTMKQWQ